MRAFRIGGEKPRRSVIEKIDRVLQFLENVLVALALAGDVGDAPQSRAFAAGPLDRAYPHAIPGDRTIAEKRRREAQLLGAALAFARGVRQPVDRLRHVGRAGEQPIDEPELRGIARTR